jgi:hypothetical protein
MRVEFSKEAAKWRARWVRKRRRPTSPLKIRTILYHPPQGERSRVRETRKETKK